MNAILVLALVFFAFKPAFADEVLLKQWIDRPFEKREVINHMPGNESFGFFYRSDDSEKGMCRIRSKIICDYGMLIQKPIAEQAVLLMVDAKMTSSKTDRDGVLDLLFRCPVVWQEKQVSLSTGAYESKFILKDAAREHMIPEAQCKDSPKKDGKARNHRRSKT